MATITTSNLSDLLREAVPEFGSTIDDHVTFYGELLPHVLFGDLTRFVISAHERGDLDIERRSLVVLDLAFRDGDESVQNIVAVSFVENVGPWDPARATFIATWPEALRIEAERQRDWSAPDA